MAYQIMKPQRILYSPMLPRTLLGGEGLLAEKLEHSGDAHRCAATLQGLRGKQARYRKFGSVPIANCLRFGGRRKKGPRLHAGAPFPANRCRLRWSTQHHPMR